MLSVSIIAGIASLAAGAVLGVLAARKNARIRVDEARAESAGLLRAARSSAAAARTAAQTEAREAALELRAEAEGALDERTEEMARREERVAAESAALERGAASLEGSWERVRERKRVIQSRREAAKRVFATADGLRAEAFSRLEAAADETGEEVAERLRRRWVEDARAEAANRLRTLDQSDPEFDEAARRVLAISAERYRNHFLTERLISNIPLLPGVGDELAARDGALLDSIGEVANVKLNLNDEQTSVRLEGLDGVGREIARRALTRLGKPKHKEAALDDPISWATDIKTHLEREIVNLGKKAFTVLEIPRSHPDIVELVGKLNYRTSYTQNQWLHAVEASFLAGMMATEMGLDEKLARKATLLHDIGKALTHEIDGSHAVIGADIARRLGEDEVIANAIGSHHADEPPTSVYAYLTAAADAMSGARPGARRQLTTEYGNRIEDLERIGNEYRGVERCFAVHGGRELRIYVQEGRLTDIEVVELSSEIADRISDEMTFPGQIKVTVIRAYEAVATAS